MHARPPDRAAVAQTDLCPRFPRPGPGAHLAGLRSLTAPRLSCRSARPLTLIPAHGYVPLIIYLEGSDAGGGAAFVEARTAEAAQRRRRGSAYVEARTTKAAQAAWARTSRPHGTAPFVDSQSSNLSHFDSSSNASLTCQQQLHQLGGCRHRADELFSAALRLTALHPFAPFSAVSWLE